MISSVFQDMKVLERALDASVLRNQAASNNLANVDTPNYKRQVVKFESFLAQALDTRKLKTYTTHKKHVSTRQNNVNDVSIKISRDNAENHMRVDGNNVDIDAEMTLLSKNNIYYNALIGQLSKKLDVIQNTITQVK